MWAWGDGPREGMEGSRGRRPLDIWDRVKDEIEIRCTGSWSMLRRSNGRGGACSRLHEGRRNEGLKLARRRVR